MSGPILQRDLPKGFSFASTRCGLKRKRHDLGAFVSEVPAATTAVFTMNRVAAAPVEISRMHLRKSRGWMRAVLANSGNANCCTGRRGLRAAAETARVLARLLGGVDPSQVLVCSTGVIGVPLRVEKILRALPKLAQDRREEPAAFEQFARAILTTDTGPKWAATQCRIGGATVRIAGCAKGSGMIHPNMATMLACVASDAMISPALLSQIVRGAVNRSFNSITVDGDTSTNDTVAVLANGESGARRIASGSGDYRKFRTALESVCHELALAIAADGEGAQRLIEIEVRGAAGDRAADQIARTIANSPLVKTALAGGDPNWGRILAAAGRSGVKFDPSGTSIRLAGVEVCRHGQEKPFSDRALHQKLLAKHVVILVDLHGGSGRARIWTCDFTGEYVRINANYRS